MSLEDNFNEARAEWKKHIKRVSYSSNPGVYVDCEPYRRLVSMGPEILPYIRKDLEEPITNNLETIGFFWLHAIYDLFGEKFSVPEEIMGRTKELVDYTIKWIDEHGKK